MRPVPAAVNRNTERRLFFAFNVMLMPLISLGSITVSSFMERFGGQRVSPPQSCRRSFAAASRILPPLPSRRGSDWSALSQLGDVRALALDRHETTREYYRSPDDRQAPAA